MAVIFPRCSRTMAAHRLNPIPVDSVPENPDDSVQHGFAVRQARQVQIGVVVEREHMVQQMMTQTLPLFAEKLKGALVIREQGWNAKARDRRRHLGAQRAFDAARVCALACIFSGDHTDREKLPDQFAAALFFIKRKRLDRRPVVFDEAVTARDFAPHGEEVVSPGAVVRKKIAETG